MYDLARHRPRVHEPSRHHPRKESHRHCRPSAAASGRYEGEYRSFYFGVRSRMAKSLFVPEPVLHLRKHLLSSYSSVPGERGGKDVRAVRSGKPGLASGKDSILLAC